MNQHEWISIPSGQGSDIAYAWCNNCGTLRIEYCGENDPYEYYVVGAQYKIENGQTWGLAEDPGCKEKPNELDYQKDKELRTGDMGRV